MSFPTLVLQFYLRLNALHQCAHLVELPESACKQNNGFQEVDANSDPSQMEADTRLVTTQPPQRPGTTLKEFPDGWAECIITAKMKARILSTPGYPQPVKPPPKTRYCISKSPKRDLGVFATESIEPGALIISERPLLLAMVSCPVLGELSKSATHEQFVAASLHSAEKFLEQAVSRMAPERQKAYRELHNSHLHDGSGPLLGVMRTNGLMAKPLCGSTPSTQCTGVCEIMSRVNHRSE